MNCTECTVQLHDYVDGDLAAERARRVDAHLAGCAACRGELESLRTLRRATAALSSGLEPRRDLWPEIAAGLEPRDTSVTPLRWLAPLGMAAAIVFLAAVAERRAPSRATWEVAALAGAPRVGATSVRGEATFRVGQWLETDAESRARIAVGRIGEVNVDPNSRLRLVGAAATDHRLELARGTLHAFIWAPPRIFFVDTPSATAVDLGCAYTLAVDDMGNGELRVETGYVALEHEGRESIIPAGLMCLTRKGTGPGTPFVPDAPEALRMALERFDFAAGGADAVRHVLAHARNEDAVTLWHLLARTSGEQRAAVFDTLARVRPPPAGVTRAGILAGDAAMLGAWATELGIGTFAGW